MMKWNFINISKNNYNAQSQYERTNTSFNLLLQITMPENELFIIYI